MAPGTAGKLHPGAELHPALAHKGRDEVSG